jgi:hypothetical protein
MMNAIIVIFILRETKMTQKIVHLLYISAVAISPTLFCTLTLLEDVVTFAQETFDRKTALEVESELLKHAIFRRSAIMIDQEVANKVINTYLEQPKRSAQTRQQIIFNTIPLPRVLFNLPLVQLNVNPQKANSCGFHALYNLKAIEDLLMTGRPITSQNVKELSKMYLDGYLLETGQKEEDLIDLAWEDKPAELARNADLKHFFLVQYYSPSSEYVKRGYVPEVAIRYNGDKNIFYSTDNFNDPMRAAEEDFKKSVKNNQLTACILGIPGHYTAYAIIHLPGKKPFIIFMNSISVDGSNSVPMEVPSGNASVARYLSQLISEMR